MYFLAKFIGPALRSLYNLVGNYAFAIILFTILMKLFLLPLSIKQIKSTKKMSELQPKLKKLQEQYKNDKETLNKKTMELYQKNGANPLSGCLPLLVQMPILFGLLGSLREPATYVFVENPEAAKIATEAGFLWLKNLTDPDLLGNVISSGPDWLLALPGIFPIISAASTYIQMNVMKSSPQQGNNMKAFAMVMPLMILWMGSKFSAGLILYWTVSNLFQIGQQYLIPKLIEED